MSKSKKSKKNSNIKKQPQKKSKKALIITICALLAIVAAAAVCFIIFSTPKSELLNTAWVASSATDASGDEADMLDVYETNYTSYQGSLTFDDDGTFDFWLTPGDPEDGTHSGKYTVNDNSTVDVTFDSGEKGSFDINRKDGKINSISVDYKGYKVYFKKQ